MKPGDWIKFESSGLNISYFVLVERWNHEGVFGCYTFKGESKMLPISTNGLFLWDDMRGMIVIKQQKRLDGLNAILKASA